MDGLPLVLAVVLQKSGQVPRHGRVRFERQADLLETGVALPLGPSRRVTVREEASDQQVADLFGVDVDLHGAAHQLAAAAQHRDGVLSRSAVGQQHLFGRAARVPQRHRLPGIQFDALLGEEPRHVVSQRDIHVVAAHQQMAAHGHPLQA